MYILSSIVYFLTLFCSIFSIRLISRPVYCRFFTNFYRSFDILYNILSGVLYDILLSYLNYLPYHPAVYSLLFILEKAGIHSTHR